MRWFLVALGTVVSGVAFNTAATSASLAGPAVIQGAGGSFSVPVVSLKEKRWTNVVRQQVPVCRGHRLPNPREVGPALRRAW